LIVNARCSWLHGDERGFRSREHRIHSSGDYKHRPPPEEHAHLRAFHKERSDDSGRFSAELRPVVARAFVEKLRSLDFQVIAVSCGEKHVHAIAELPHDLEQIRRIVGKCKQLASHRVRARLPGSVWSDGGEYKWINGPSHLRNAYEYVRTKQEAGAVVWSHRPDENWIDDPRVAVVVMRRK
jgi:REP element-mobilizing transposase RayT